MVDGAESSGSVLDIVALSQECQASMLTKSASGTEAFEKQREYLRALRSLEGQLVVASYSFMGILVGCEEDARQFDAKPHYTHLGQQVCRQEVEVIIDEVRSYDGSVFVRFPGSNSVVAEQASVTNIVIHKLGSKDTE